MTNQDSKTRKILDSKVILAVVAGIAVVFFIVSYVEDQRTQELQLQTQLLIAEQEALLATISEITARNGADAVTERIIRDCSLAERTQFDSLLGRLDTGLSRAQLVELERLFGRCGDFYSQRKSVMSARLHREIEIYEILVNQLNNLTDSENAEQYRIADWKSLAELEVKQSVLFSELVAVQDEIISLLLEGSQPGSEAVTLILREATEIQETLVVTNSQASTLRASLISL